MANVRPLLPKQKLFVAEYLASRNATDAYRKAGYAPKDADVAGPRLLGNVGIAEKRGSFVNGSTFCDSQGVRTVIFKAAHADTTQRRTFRPQPIPACRTRAA